MKPASLHVLATVALASAAGLIYQEGGSTDEAVAAAEALPKKPGSREAEKIPVTWEASAPSSVRRNIPAMRMGEIARSPESSPSPQVPTAKPRSMAPSTQAPPHARSQMQDGADGHPHDSTAGPTPIRTIQLAANFQLPVAMLPQAPAANHATTPVKDATRVIVDDFYRKLAERLPDGPSSEFHEDTAPLPEDGNLVIQPDPESESVRKHADELYRTLFGDEAFGRMSMESAREVRLPEEVSVTGR